MPIFIGGCITGVTTALFGFGGGFVVVPLLYALAVATDSADPMHVAIATSSAIMIVNSLIASLAQLKAGRLKKDFLWPLAAYIALGASGGAFLGRLMSDEVLRIVFVVYLGITILDTLFRRGFLDSQKSSFRGPLQPATAAGAGIVIGAVASALGVGGSVMTVPLLRRRGLLMVEATAMANPLSVPIAVAGTVMYGFVSTGSPAGAEPGHVGLVNVAAAITLLAGSVPIIFLVKRLVRKISDKAHAVAYVGLLAVALVGTIIV